MGTTVSSFNATARFTRVPDAVGVADASPSGSQGVVQFSNQAFGPDPKVCGLACPTLLRLVKIIRDVQGSQDGNLRRIHRRCPFRYFFHSRVDEAGQVMNVGAVTFGADVVGLAEDLHLRDAAPHLHAMASGGLLSRAECKFCHPAESTVYAMRVDRLSPSCPRPRASRRVFPAAREPLPALFRAAPPVLSSRQRPSRSGGRP